MKNLRLLWKEYAHLISDIIPSLICPQITPQTKAIADQVISDGERQLAELDRDYQAYVARVKEIAETAEKELIKQQEKFAQIRDRHKSLRQTLYVAQTEFEKNHSAVPTDGSYRRNLVRNALSIFEANSVNLSLPESKEFAIVLSDGSVEHIDQTVLNDLASTKRSDTEAAFSRYRAKMSSEYYRKKVVLREQKFVDIDDGVDHTAHNLINSTRHLKQYIETRTKK